jgi:hypothetical protein
LTAPAPSDDWKNALFPVARLRPTTYSVTTVGAPVSVPESFVDDAAVKRMTGRLLMTAATLTG